MLTNRIGIFVSLPLASIGRLSLRRKLHDIGTMNDTVDNMVQPT